MPKHSAKDTVREWALIVWGGLLRGGLQLFLLSERSIPGGVTGIATIVNYLTHWPVGVVSMVINIPLFAFAWRHFGGVSC